MSNIPLRQIKLSPTQVDPSLVREAVDAIRKGDRVVLPTETVYGLVALPGDDLSIARLRQTKQRPPEHKLSLHISDRTQLEKFACSPLPYVERLLARFWPGPLTVVLNALDGGTVGLRVPAQPFTQAVIKELGGSIFLSSVNISGEKPLLSADEIAAGFPNIDVIFDAGPPHLGIASTVVRLTGPEPEVLREGILDRNDIAKTIAKTIIFVCSGNTCRSPIAEGAAKSQIAERLNSEVGDLLARRINVESAGVSAFAGLPASQNAIAAAADIGVDLSKHRATPLSVGDISRASAIYCLASHHYQQVKNIAHDQDNKVKLLRKDGADIQDPFGSQLETYQRARDQIVEALSERKSEILALFDIGAEQKG